MPTQNMQRDIDEAIQKLEKLQRDLHQQTSAGKTGGSPQQGAFETLGQTIQQIKDKLQPYAEAIKSGDTSQLTPDQKQKLSSAVDSTLNGIHQLKSKGTPDKIRLALSSKAEQLAETLEEISKALRTSGRASKPSRDY